MSTDYSGRKSASEEFQRSINERMDKVFGLLPVANPEYNDEAHKAAGAEFKVDDQLIAYGKEIGRLKIALKSIANGDFIGASVLAKNGNWHAYTITLQQIAEKALSDVG